MEILVFGDYTLNQVKHFFAISFSYEEVSRRMGLARRGSTQQLKFLTLQHDLDISHFTRNTKKKPQRRLSDTELFTDTSFAARSTVRNRLIKKKIIPYACAICGNNGTWRGTKMSLILDHIDGIFYNHKLENLRFLCPNCNVQQDTFARGGYTGVREKKPKKKNPIVPFLFPLDECVNF